MMIYNNFVARVTKCSRSSYTYKRFENAKLQLNFYKNSKKVQDFIFTMSYLCTGESFEIIESSNLAASCRKQNPIMHQI